MAFVLLSRSKTQGSVKPLPKRKSARAQHSARLHPSQGRILQRKCACGGAGISGGCEECSKKKRLGLQTKLKVNEPGDSYEREADRIADQVMAAPVYSGVCSAPPRIQRLAGQPTGQTDTAPASVDRVLASPGRPLESALRHDMEQRFGHDFSGVRVHPGPIAERSVQDMNAHAYTVRHNIVFGAGRFAPGTQEGRRLLAHELTHVVQQSGGAPAIQRFVPCTRARMSLEECPHREPGEESKSRREPMLVVYITAPEEGYLITNFDIGQSKLKASAKFDPEWPTMIKTITQAGSQWELLGLSDCHGEERLNIALRQQRADAVRAALPPAAAAHIVRSSGASLHNCITDNENRIARQWNRSVLLRQIVTTIHFPAEVHEIKIPTEEPDTENCDKSQRDTLARAFPLAKKMVRAALGALDNANLMRKYFGKDALAHRFNIKQNFVEIKEGLDEGPTFECEEADSRLCKGAEAYVIGIIGENIHICSPAFTKGVDFLARTLVHESAHRFAWVFFPDELCAGGCPSSMDTTDAVDNADSYGEFAGDAFAQSP
jgi:hypothetical protein